MPIAHSFFIRSPKNMVPASMNMPIWQTLSLVGSFGIMGLMRGKPKESPYSGYIYSDFPEVSRWLRLKLKHFFGWFKYYFVKHWKKITGISLIIILFPGLCGGNDELFNNHEDSLIIKGSNLGKTTLRNTFVGQRETIISI